MNDVGTLPPELITVIGSESQDFAVETRRDKPLANALHYILFATFWLGVSGTIAYGFLGAIFGGDEIHMTVNGVPKTITLENIGELIPFIVFISIFLLIGLGLLSHGIYLIFKKGGYFVGTPTRLIHFRKGTLNTYNWEQFTGSMNIKRQDLTLEMRTGKMVSSKNRGRRFVPNRIYLSGIANPYDIEALCRKRIKEHDPTPANIS